MRTHKCGRCHACLELCRQLSSRGHHGWGPLVDASILHDGHRGRSDLHVSRSGILKFYWVPSETKRSGIFLGGATIYIGIFANCRWDKMNMIGRAALPHSKLTCPTSMGNLPQSIYVRCTASLLLSFLNLREFSRAQAPSSPSGSPLCLPVSEFLMTLCSCLDSFTKISSEGVVGT